MKKLLPFLLLFFVCSCGQSPGGKSDKDSLSALGTKSQKDKWLELRATQTRIDSLALVNKRADSVEHPEKTLPYVEESADSMIKHATSDHYIVFASESFDYNQLLKNVRNLSKRTRIPYDDEGLTYDPMLGLIWPADTSQSRDIYSGGYFMRRYGTMNGAVNFLSLEMRDWYFKVPYDKMTLKMIIVAGIYSESEKKEAEARLKQIRKYDTTACIMKIPIYMGCIH
jgi:hypothetical protein